MCISPVLRLLAYIATLYITFVLFLNIDINGVDNTFILNGVYNIVRTGAKVMIVFFSLIEGGYMCKMCVNNKL